MGHRITAAESLLVKSGYGEYDTSSGQTETWLGERVFPQAPDVKRAMIPAQFL